MVCRQGWHWIIAVTKIRLLRSKPVNPSWTSILWEGVKDIHMGRQNVAGFPPPPAQVTLQLPMCLITKCSSAAQHCCSELRRGIYSLMKINSISCTGINTGIVEILQIWFQTTTIKQISQKSELNMNFSVSQLCLHYTVVYEVWNRICLKKWCIYLN